MCYKPIYLPFLDLFVPCGKCLECSQSVSTEWALRICLEASLYERNCCLTLTYNDAHLPDGGLLCPRDYQLFLKRLRKAIAPAKVRYFLSGEYGDKRGRPHFHVILFGYCPDDLVFKFSRKGRDFYTSDFIQSVWAYESKEPTDFRYRDKYYDTIGHILVGMVDWHTAFYTAKYLQKLLFSNKEVPPFVRMSTRPGLGIDAFRPQWLQTDKVYFNGRTYRIPRYFYKVLDREGVVLDEIKSHHFAKARSMTFQLVCDDLAARENKARDFLGVPRVMYNYPTKFYYDYLFMRDTLTDTPSGDYSAFGREWWYSAFEDIKYGNYKDFVMPQFYEQLTFL